MPLGVRNNYLEEDRTNNNKFLCPKITSSMYQSWHKILFECVDERDQKKGVLFLAIFRFEIQMHVRKSCGNVRVI